MAITQATSLADFSTGIGTAGAVLQVDNVDGQVGIGTTDPQGTLQVGIAITMDGTAGVITASSFSGSGGNLSFTGADISAATASFTGNVSVGGTLTYEDVTNIDAVGVITARTGVKVTAGGVDVTAGGLNVTAGISTFSKDILIGTAATVGFGSTAFFRDDAKAIFGAGEDLQIYHSNSRSVIEDSGTGSLEILASNFVVKNAADNKNYIFGADGGAVTLYYDNSAKFATKSDGVDITGELQCDSLDVDGDADITGTTNFHGNVDLQDNDYLRIGTGDDLQLYHNAYDSYVDNTATGDFLIRNLADDKDIRFVCDNGSGGSANYILIDGSSGAVILYHYGTEKFTTTSSGVEITGTLSATGNITQNGNALATNGKAVAMALVFG